MQHVRELLTEPVLLAGLGLCSLALRTWKASRKIKFLKELLRREREKSFARHNATVKILSEAFSRGQPASLEDLLSKVERDWSLKSAPKYSAEDDNEPTMP